MVLVIFGLFAKCRYCFAYWMPSKYLVNTKNIIASETEICNLDPASRKTHWPAVRSMVRRKPLVVNLPQLLSQGQASLEKLASDRARK